MDTSQKPRTGLANSELIRSVARRLDEFISVHELPSPRVQRALQNVYGAHIFTSPVLAQPASPFLSLPAEVRCIIYQYTFTPDDDLPSTSTIDSIAFDSESGSEQLALLLTCRQIYSEAYKIAFSGCTFSLRSWKKGIAISKRLATLGPLQVHLRHVEITMPPSKLKPLSRDNPFTLMQLHLTTLEIGFLEETRNSWKDAVNVYYLIVSALCHFHQDEDKQGKVTGPCQPIHTLFKEKEKRRVELQRFTYKPAKEDVYRALEVMRTKKVVVRAYSDLLYKAFLFFDLIVVSFNKILIKGSDAYKYLVLFKEGWGEMGFMELGRFEGGGG